MFPEDTSCKIFLKSPLSPLALVHNEVVTLMALCLRTTVALTKFGHKARTTVVSFITWSFVRIKSVLWISSSILSLSIMTFGIMSIHNKVSWFIVSSSPSSPINDCPHAFDKLVFEVVVSGDVRLR